MVKTSGPAKRPGPVTAISIVLAFLSIAGFGNAVVWNQPEVAAAASQLGLNVGGLAQTSLSIVYALAALTSAVGLWRLASWARSAFIVWCLSVVLFDVWMIYSGLLRPVGTAGACFVLFASVVVLGGLYWFLADVLRWTARSE
jgi:hypothetical protein